MFNDISTLIIILALATFALVIVFALRSKAATEERRQDANAPKSTLAADAPSRNAPNAGPEAEQRAGY